MLFYSFLLKIQQTNLPRAANKLPNNRLCEVYSVNNCNVSASVSGQHPVVTKLGGRRGSLCRSLHMML